MLAQERVGGGSDGLAAYGDLNRLLQFDAAERKTLVRAHMKAARSRLSEDDRTAASERIAREVISGEAYRRAKTIFSYLSFGTEVDTRGIIRQAWDDGKVVALPRCIGPRALRWYRVDSFEGLEKSRYGIWEPAQDPAAEVGPEAAVSSLAIVPGLAFDGSGMRLGYGGGYYDAFLASFSGAAIGVCFSGQLIPSLSAYGLIDPHDQPVSQVIVG